MSLRLRMPLQMTFDFSNHPQTVLRMMLTDLLSSPMAIFSTSSRLYLHSSPYSSQRKQRSMKSTIGSFAPTQLTTPLICTQSSQSITFPGYYHRRACKIRAFCYGFLVLKQTQFLAKDTTWIFPCRLVSFLKTESSNSFLRRSSVNSLQKAYPSLDSSILGANNLTSSFQLVFCLVALLYTLLVSLKMNLVRLLLSFLNSTIRSAFSRFSLLLSRFCLGDLGWGYPSMYCPLTTYLLKDSLRVYLNELAFF